MKPNDAAKLFTRIMLAQAGEIGHTGGVVAGKPGYYFIRFEWEIDNETKRM